jgi:hypothetical protein
VATGGVRLRFVADAADGEGLSGLVLEVADLGAARPALSAFRPSADAHGFHLDPGRCHGVPLRFQRGT